MEGKVFLGIESTAHTLGIGIYSEEEGILANVYDTYMGKDGILPREAADHHSRLFAELLSRAFEESRLSIADIDVVAVAQGPGIGAPLSFGVAMARYLASKYGKELVGVNHPYAHIVIVEEASGVNASLVLYVSGGNTQILAKGSDGLFYVLGETLDIGMGNLYDTFMRKAGIRPAHGSKLSEIASKGSFVALPYTVKGMNLQFSGLLTAALSSLNKGENLANVAHSLMETSMYMVAEATERALHLTRAGSLVLCGGVAQNKRLQEIIRIIGEDNGIAVGIAEDSLNRDNGAMIAYAGSLLYKKFGPTEAESLVAMPNYRIDQIREVASSSY